VHVTQGDDGPAGREDPFLVLPGVSNRQSPGSRGIPYRSVGFSFDTRSFTVLTRWGACSGSI
jgi:hypothetical protein